jgi:hypothetical protein
LWFYDDDDVSYGSVFAFEDTGARGKGRGGTLGVLFCSLFAFHAQDPGGEKDEGPRE